MLLPILSSIRQRRLVQLVGLLLLSLTSLRAVGTPPPLAERRITLQLSNQELKTALRLIGQQADVKFVYSSHLIDTQQRVTLQARQQPLDEVLAHLLTPLSLRFEILQKQVVINRAPATGAVLPAQLPTVRERPLPVAVTVSGRVTQAGGEGLPGVTIVVKGTTNGTTSDGNGNFSLSLPDANATLVVSAIGFATQEIPLQGRTQVDILLQADVRALDDVVVVGYTSQRRANLTGAVSQVTQRDIADLPVTGPAQILQGKAAGVAITQQTGAPGEGIAVRIRGIGTINDNEPLYIIDGVPTVNGINQISPNDIESINILKDASSAAIYGARAAGGVVIVTTKRGKSGKPRLTASAYGGVQTASNLIKMANTSQYVAAFNVAAQNDGREPIPASVAATLPDVNWLKEVLQPAAQYNAQLDVSGGTDASQYIVSGSYVKQDGLIRNSSFDRYNLRTAVTSTLSKYVKLGTNANLSYAKTRQVGTSGDGFGDGNPGASIVRYALFRTPGTPVYNAQGQFVDLPTTPDGALATGFLGDGINPVALADAADRNFYRYSLLGNIFAEVTPVKHLRLRSDFGTNFFITDYKQFFKTFGINRSFNSPAQLAQSNTKEFNYNWTNTAVYELPVGRHNVSLLLGTEAIKNDVQAISASRRGYVDQSGTFQYLDNGTGIQQNGGNQAHFALFSGFSQLSYDFDGRYLASFNFRRDGSSQFLPGRRAESFYSGSLGWNLAQESFLRDNTTFSVLKLRASLGQVGNSRIGNYPYASLVGGNFYYPFGGVSTQGLSIVSKGNPNIRWETSTQSNVGLDVGVLQGALQLSVDYFVKNTSNVLLNLPLPSSAGNGGNPAVNAGKIRNQGLEVELNYRRTAGPNWSYGLSGNLATLQNKAISLADALPLVGGRIDNNYYATLTQAGHPIGAFYLLQTDGIFQNAQEVFTHAYQGPGIQPGDVRYKDLSGPDGVPDGIIDGYDRTFVGSPIPKLTYGATGTLRFKNLDLSLFFQGVAGNKLYNQINTDIEGFYRAFNLTERAATNYWTGEGSTNEFPRLSWTGASNNKQPSDRFLEDGSYLRLKNLQVGYTFGEKVLAPVKVSSVRLFVSLQNLLTFTNYTGLDPEQGTNSNSAGEGVRAVGIDFGTYPSSRVFTAGFNVGF